MWFLTKNKKADRKRSEDTFTSVSLNSLPLAA